MTKQEITEVVSNHISKSNLEEALRILSIYAKGKDQTIENDILLQTSTLSRINKDFVNSLLSRDDFDRSTAKIRYALTQIIDDLPQTGNSLTNKTSNKNDVTPIRKILFLSANPRDTQRIRLDEELRKIKDELALSENRKHFDLENEPAVKVPTITRAMQMHNPEIVHFSGHGDGEAGLAVENNYGNTILFPTDGLNRLFKNHKETVKCVILNACYSKEQATIISKHGIYVIGMNKAIGDDAAISFAIGFYQSLGAGKDYEFAFNNAMTNISPYLKDANTPELWLNGNMLEDI